MRYSAEKNLIRPKRGLRPGELVEHAILPVSMGYEPMVVVGEYDHRWRGRLVVVEHLRPTYAKNARGRLEWESVEYPKTSLRRLRVRRAPTSVVVK